ncbi:restriction endonuclease [Halovulum dunhuangense]|uniref:Restriction endonuclease n=1 Tax=Halovulum dunhuangense TaxID=1505036 RepID=A0A849L739_9RHOB|nr:type I restriction endonuclease [Halovulum dunhuangense]NNU81952.1 restriction endonuclease [Halovulum dunhuangense]
MSALEPAIKVIAARVNEHAATIATEEAAKTSVVLPFLQALGYDVFNPAEVIPEFTADAVGKKGEKVDYAVKVDGEMRFLIECKGLSTKLERNHLSQLFRYFTVTDAKFALLTNGREYRFYTDLEEPNKLDQRPFFVFDILDVNPSAFVELRKFEKSAFDMANIMATAERLKYVSAVKAMLLEQMETPSDELVRLVAGVVHDGRLTAQVRDLVGGAIKSAFREVVRDAVQARLSSALQSSELVDSENSVEAVEPVDDIVTTQEEIEGMLTIKSIVRAVIDSKRVGLRDAKSYCAILVDDNNRKPLARLHFNRSQKYIGLFDGETEERIAISGLDDIFQYSERLKETAKRYT